MTEQSSPAYPAPDGSGPSRPTVAAPTHRPLEPEQLRWICDPAQLAFETTEELQPLDGTIGQDRAVRALTFGLEMRGDGFNLFVAGPRGTGRSSTVDAYVRRLAEAQPAPDDWCYVHNFKDATCPTALKLPSGRAAVLAQDMRTLMDAVRRDLRRVFESREYRQQQQETYKTVADTRDRLIGELGERAQQHGLALSMTPAGPMVVPLSEGRPMSQEELLQLPDQERERLNQQGEELARALREIGEQVRQLERDTHQRVIEQDAQVAHSTIEPLVRELEAKYSDQASVQEYLSQVQEDLIAQAEEIHRVAVANAEADRGASQAMPPGLAQLQQQREEAIFQRYRVAVLVDNGDTRGAPVVVESNPTYYNLLGRMEYRSELGSMVTDFSMIKAGALHRANGGYLVLHATDVLTSPGAWDVLKRSLKTGLIRIENIGEQFTAIPAATLRPAPIPLDVKVVLIGPPNVYYLLQFQDEDFSKLFRVRADFDTEISLTDEHLARYAAFVAGQVREGGLRHFHRGAVAKIAEYGARLDDHQAKLSARFQQIADVVAEASFWAAKTGSQLVMAEHVAQAIDEKTYRSNLMEDKIRELINDGTLLIDVTGKCQGQVNGLSVLDLGDYSFGRPMRITAQTALGADGFTNLDRETRLSGRIHSKGFLILTSFLQSRYAQDKPLAISGRITFEQSYGEVEGDSASSTEVYALLSALSGLPLRQGIAVTGSVNQRGEVQSVGGVTRKIEGFYDVCRLQGLTGEQGVLIPPANVKNLMLREDVVEAVRQGRFHIWAVASVDEGMEILTGVKAGAQRDGRWEPGTVNERADNRLRDYAERLKGFGRAPGPGEVAERSPAEVNERTPRLTSRLR
jgi:lon-related putative ATP-dependent protease